MDQLGFGVGYDGRLAAKQNVEYDPAAPDVRSIRDVP